MSLVCRSCWGCVWKASGTLHADAVIFSSPEKLLKLSILMLWEWSMSLWSARACGRGGGGRCLIVVWVFAQVTRVISLLSHNKVFFKLSCVSLVIDLWKVMTWSGFDGFVRCLIVLYFEVILSSFLFVMSHYSDFDRYFVWSLILISGFYWIAGINLF
jgi:hypothetical protein